MKFCLVALCAAALFCAFAACEKPQQTAPQQVAAPQEKGGQPKDLPRPAVTAVREEKVRRARPAGAAKIRSETAKAEYSPIAGMPAPAMPAKPAQPAEPAGTEQYVDHGVRQWVDASADRLSTFAV
ncbi:MAG: hypothetical protein JXR96_07675, partial [Deltaproteobacteria bacterium]|nr:hypothetical protein [Deltaproteobacteria bacterium]